MATKRPRVFGTTRGASSAAHLAFAWSAPVQNPVLGIKLRLIPIAVSVLRDSPGSPHSLTCHYGRNKPGQGCQRAWKKTKRVIRRPDTVTRTMVRHGSSVTFYCRYGQPLGRVEASHVTGTNFTSWYSMTLFVVSPQRQETNVKISLRVIF